MGKKLSSLKGKKIIDLYQKGYNQSLIAKMLHIDQSTVSKYINRFKALKEQKGINAALQEFAIEDEFEENQTVVAELKKSDLSIADVDIALQVENVLQECGIPHEVYHDFIQTVKKTKDAGYIDAALALNKLENKTGMSYGEIGAKADKAYLQVQKSQKELQVTNSKVEASNKKLAEMQQKEKQATYSLQKHMQQIGVDEQRLKSIEPLALAVKKAKIPNQMLAVYLARQESLNKAGIGIDMFTGILDKAKVVTSGDDGNHLLDMLKECGSLSGVIYQQQAKKQLLDKEVSDLEAQRKIRDELVGEIKKLKGDKSDLEADIAQIEKQKVNYVAQYNKQKNESEQLAGLYYSAQNSYQELLKAKTPLENEISEKQTARDSIDSEIKDKQQKLSNLGELELKHGQLTKENAELEGKLSQNSERLASYESFLGFLQESSPEILKKKAAEWLSHLSDPHPTTAPTDILRNLILKELAGPEVNILECETCQSRFVVNKASPTGVYTCPTGLGFHHTITVDKGATEVLRTALSLPKPVEISINRIIVKPKPPKAAPTSTEPKTVIYTVKEITPLPLKIQPVSDAFGKPEDNPK